MSNFAIELKNVGREFEQGKIQALNEITFSINKGERVALTGPSGSGKSTLLNILGTLDFASRGKTIISGQEILRHKTNSFFRNKNIGFVFQLFHLIPELTLLENVAVALKPRNISARECRQRSEEILYKVGLHARKDALPTTISGGERQRTAIARAIVTNPEIILADEPTGNLDSKSGHQILDLLEQVSADSKATLIMVTHQLDFAKRFNRIISLEDGRITRDQKSASITSDGSSNS